MPFIQTIRRAIRRTQNGFNTRGEFLLWFADSVILKTFHKRSHFYARARTRSYKQFMTNRLKPDANSYHINDVRLPLLDDIRDEKELAERTFGDTFWSYVHCGDEYSEKIFDHCDEFLDEGLYGLVNEKVNVTIKPGDIVIDAGSWIGDFAAYASVKGAMVYAFEPSEKNFAYLEKTAAMNKNIMPVKKGISNETRTMKFFINDTASSFVDTEIHNRRKFEIVETVRLDDFVRDNNLPRVDFIKADIEGFERNMLAGAQQTLRDYAPKLALCTYHLPDDPEVMAGLILKANPKYNIVQKRMKLFASV